MLLDCDIINICKLFRAAEVAFPVGARAAEDVEVDVAAYAGHFAVVVVLPVGPVAVGGVVGELADP